MALWDLLVNAGNNVKQGVGGLYDKIRPTQAVITPIQQAENGGVDLQRSLELALAQPKSLKENLLGRTVTIDSEAVNPDTNELEVSRVSKFQPGLFNDISAGAKENFATGFAAPNWEENKTADGRQKGLGYRIGEGLGTFGRFAESPLGRGLLMAGIVGAAGGSGLEALGYGAGAGVANQQNRMKDTMYRRELEKYGIDTSGIRGYIGDDTFNKYLQSKQLQDNAEYRNLMLATQQRNQELANEIAKEKFSYQKASDAADRALKTRQLDIQERKIEETSNKKAINAGNLQAVSNQLQRFEKTFEKMPNKLESNTLGRLRNATGFQTPQEANFNSQRTLLFNKIARDLGGEKGVLSDQDIKRIENSLPNYTDSYVQKQAKMQAIYDLLNDRLSVEGESLQETDNDPLGIL